MEAAVAAVAQREVIQMIVADMLTVVAMKEAAAAQVKVAAAQVEHAWQRKKAAAAAQVEHAWQQKKEQEEQARQRKEEQEGQAPKT